MAEVDAACDRLERAWWADGRPRIEDDPGLPRLCRGVLTCFGLIDRIIRVTSRLDASYTLVKFSTSVNGYRPDDERLAFPESL